MTKRNNKTRAKTLFGYDSEYSTHFEALEELESKGDIIDCESISLHDKMRFLMNGNKYTISKRDDSFWLIVLNNRC